MDAFHVKPYKCPQPASSAASWVFSTQIMSLRVGNASVALLFTPHELMTQPTTTTTEILPITLSFYHLNIVVQKLRLAWLFENVS